MSLSTSFDYLSFQRKVQDALQTVERALELERKPKLAGDVDHTYGAKYGLVNLTSNAAIIAYMNCFEKLGLDANVFKSIDKTKPATLRFDSSSSSKFLKEVAVDVPLNRSYEEVTTESSPAGTDNSTKTRVLKTINHITEVHWEVEVNWSISIYSGTSLDDTKVSKSRRCTTQIITQGKQRLNTKVMPPIELSLNWLLQQFDSANLATQFKVDTEADATKTPRRNDAVQNAVDFASQLIQWCNKIQSAFIGHLQRDLLNRHNPALPDPTSQSFNLQNLMGTYSVFNPILPLMDETGQAGEGDGIHGSIIHLNNEDRKNLLSKSDMSKLVSEHARSLDEAFSGIEKSLPPDGSNNILASSEAALALISTHLRNLASQYMDSMYYIETMMENQLVAAIGKRLTPRDLDKFVKFHNARLLQPMPQPFSHAIRRPEHYPVGLLSIESQDSEENECIYSHSREVNPTSNLKIPLNAATALELTGQQYLHGYLNLRFGPNHKSHKVVARARQFSSFILVIGTMMDGSTLDPKDAIIVQNKDELIIPLLLDELPTAKEFKDAIKSLSPEQQRFARAYRKMQLASSVFGICVIQIKPQLEALLGLPPDSLDKEMKLTQDLTELFIEYQVPSDLLSYNGVSEDVAREDKVSNVRDNVKNVVDVIEAEKEKQLKAEKSKTEMAAEKGFQDAMATPFCSSPFATEAASFSFGAPVSAPAGGEFGSAPAPFGSTPAPSSSLFGAPAPAPADKFYSSLQPFGSHSTATAELFDLDAQRDVLCQVDEEVTFSQPEVQEPISSLDDVTAGTKRAADNIQNQPSTEEGGKKSKVSNEKGSSGQSSDVQVNFTLIPQLLDSTVEKNGEGNVLRTTVIKTGDHWTRSRQENLLTAAKKRMLNKEEIKKEKNKAFDLLDALSRSGSLPIKYSELHVVIAVTHCFDKDVMSTVVCDNINPIEKLECSTLLLASAMHGVPARELIRDVNELQRLEGAMPLLLQARENNNDDD